MNENENKEDKINHPEHYTYGGIECIDAIEAVTQGLTGRDAFLTGQIIKYMWRWKHKNGYEDLQKAHWYLVRLMGKEYEKCKKSEYAYHVE